MKGTTKMKYVITAVIIAVSYVSISETVTPDLARAAASGWIAENNSISAGCGEIVSVSPVLVDDGTANVAYYKVICSGGTVMVSADTDFPPIMAYIPGKSGHDGSANGSSLWAFLMEDAKSFRAQSKSVRTSLKSSGPSKNRTRWGALMSGRRLLKTVSGTGSPSQYVIPGFESGGKYTHWDQSDAPYVTEGWFSLYNYYLFGTAFGGPYGGLPIEVPPSRKLGGVSGVPCGCTATAWSAAFQCVGVTGAVSKACSVTGPFSAYYDPSAGSPWREVDWTVSSLTARTLPGTYDWSSLPSNLGGHSPAKTVKEGDVGIRELIGRVTYNCGLAVNMAYGRSGSAAYPYTMLTLGFGANGVFPGMSLGWSCGRGQTQLTREEMFNFVRSGRPLVVTTTMTVSSSGDTHCILYTGHDYSTGFVRAFFGWGGDTDGWYNFEDSSSTQAASVIMYGVYENNAVPLFGRVCNSSGKPLHEFVIVYCGTERLATFETDDDGYFRGFYRAPSGTTQTGTQMVSFDEKLVIGETVVTSNRTLAVSGELMSSSVARMRTADRGIITASGSGVPIGISFYSGDGDLTVPLETASDTGRSLVVIGGDANTNMSDVANYIINNNATLRDSIVSCYSVSTNLVLGEYIILDPNSVDSSNPYRRSAGVLGYGSSTSERDIKETIRKAVSQR